MKTYSEILAIEPTLELEIDLGLIGQPEYTLKVNNILYTDRYNLIRVPIEIPIEITIELYNKIYVSDSETAIQVNAIRIENELIIPRYDHLVEYVNDHNYTKPTNYIGFNGVWKLSLQPCFFHWLHRVTGQGWIIS
jgi:hypothetical protein